MFASLRIRKAALLLSVVLFNQLANAQQGCSPATRYRTLDGRCNNPIDPMLGATGNTLFMPDSLMPDNITEFLPSARQISNQIMSTWWSPKSERLTDLFTYHAQLIDHDIIRFGSPDSLANRLPIFVSKTDAQFHGPMLPFKRLSVVNTPKGPSPENQISSFIDASIVYGTTEKMLHDLRNGTDGCRMNVAEDDMLPFKPGSSSGMFLAGDSRVNENSLLAALHTLWMREHNTLCGELRSKFPGWTNERTFQEARKILGAELQAVTYEEWLPSIVGPSTIPQYSGYNESTDPRPSLIFAGASFRLGHVLVNDAVVMLQKNGTETRLGVDQTLFATNHLLNWGIDAVIRGAISNRAKKVNLHVVHALRNCLITKKGGRLLDLASINIQRGRDLQVPLYNEARKQYGLKELKKFDDITSNKNSAQKLKKTYGNIDIVDAWVGGLAEDREDGNVMGPFFTASWIDDFRRIRDGDSFFYKRPEVFEEKMVQKIPMLKRVLDKNDQTVMKNIIIRNTKLENSEVPDNPFVPYEN